MRDDTINILSLRIVSSTHFVNQKKTPKPAMVKDIQEIQGI